MNTSEGTYNMTLKYRTNKNKKDRINKRKAIIRNTIFFFITLSLALISLYLTVPAIRFLNPINGGVNINRPTGEKAGIDSVNDSNSANGNDSVNDSNSANENDSVNRNEGKPEVLIPGFFPEKYSEIEGVLTFRGDNRRSSPSFGYTDSNFNPIKLTKLWSFRASAKKESLWGGGAGWTGQPAIIKWNKQVLGIMNVKNEFKRQDDFVEVIQASLNGKIYFLDLKTGKQTREPIDTKDPIKGSVSVDPRGYPLLYTGQGIRESNELGFYIYSLIDQKPLFFRNGLDKNAPRKWPAFDSSALFNRSDDTLTVGAENGLVYSLKLNTKLDLINKKISINPVEKWYSTNSKFSGAKQINTGTTARLGIENSLSSYNNLLFFGDNGGTLRCLDTSLLEKWRIKTLDDSDSSMIVDVENEKPYLYTGCEVDHQGSPGYSKIMKLDGLTGKTIWQRDFKCYSRYGDSPSNGGALASPINGKNDIKNLVIFTLCRHPKFDTGTMYAFDKNTGKTVWKLEMSTYAWPSPVDVYNKDGKSIIIQNDHSGNMLILEGKTGKLLKKLSVDSYLEASPAVFNNYVVFTSRYGNIYCYKIE